MRKIAGNLQVHILATACAALLAVGCSEEVIDDTEKELLAEWNGVVQRIAAAKSMTWECSLHICKKVSDRTDGDQRKRILHKFSNMLHAIDISPLGLFDQLRSIDMAFDASYYLARVPEGLTDRERWQILLSALAWEHSQFIRIAHTDRSVFMKRNSKWEAQKRIIPEAGIEDTLLLRFPEDVSRPSDLRLQCTLDGISKGVKESSSVRLKVIKRLATDVEGDRYSDEIRTWVRAEMEKIIGRPLTDDDLWFKDEIIQRREERKKRAHDEEVRRPHDGGDVLPHPFTFLGCTFGNAYEVSRRGGKDTLGDVILCWYSNFAIEPYLGKKWMTLNLAPRSKIAYSAEIEWWDRNTREELALHAKKIKDDIEKRLGVTLGDFFFESGGHVRDKEAWKSGGGVMKSRSVFGPIMIEISASDSSGNDKHVDLVITDTAAEALVEKERKENPLTYDSKAEEAAERRKFEQLKEMNRRRKVIPAKNTTK